MSPVYPIVPEAPALTGNYPHMGRRDAAIWERFLRQRGEIFGAVAYDVAFGGVLPDTPGMREEDVKGWQYSTAAKVDVVGFRSDEVWICEVKPNASLGSLGQAIGYAILAEREEFTLLPLVPTIITDNMGPDVRYVAESLNVQVIIVPEGEGVEFI